MEVNQRHLETTELLKQFSDTARAVYGDHAYTAGFYETMLAQLISTYLTEPQYGVLMDSFKEINQRHTMQLLSKK
jgi:hypothetical protein